MSNWRKDNECMSVGALSCFGLLWPLSALCFFLSIRAFLVLFQWIRALILNSVFAFFPWSLNLHF